MPPLGLAASSDTFILTLWSFEHKTKGFQAFLRITQKNHSDVQYFFQIYHLHSAQELYSTVYVAACNCCLLRKEDPSLYAQHVLWIRMCSIYQELDIIIGNGAGLTNLTNPSQDTKPTSQLGQTGAKFHEICQPRALRPRAAVESPFLRPQLS